MLKLVEDKGLHCRFPGAELGTGEVNSKINFHPNTVYGKKYIFPTIFSGCDYDLSISRSSAHAIERLNHHAVASVFFEVRY